MDAELVVDCTATLRIWLELDDKAKFELVLELGALLLIIELEDVVAAGPLEDPRALDFVGLDTGARVVLDDEPIALDVVDEIEELKPDVDCASARFAIEATKRMYISIFMMAMVFLSETFLHRFDDLRDGKCSI